MPVTSRKVLDRVHHLQRRGIDLSVERVFDTNLVNGAITTTYRASTFDGQVRMSSWLGGRAFMSFLDYYVPYLLKSVDKVPDTWPSTVIDLAESLHQGEDCGFALHDALIEAGLPRLAVRATNKTDAGYVVRVILGK